MRPSACPRTSRTGEVSSDFSNLPPRLHVPLLLRVVMLCGVVEEGGSEESPIVSGDRMAGVPPHRCLHDPAVERLAILELRGARGWSAAPAAERFFVTQATVAAWMARLNEDGLSAGY